MKNEYVSVLFTKPQGEGKCFVEKTWKNEIPFMEITEHNDPRKTTCVWNAQHWRNPSEKELEKYGENILSIRVESYPTISLN